MAEEHILIDDILSSEKERMLYLKKYYPFFVLQETSLGQYKEGRFQELDMGYITMALLRFLIQENHFNGHPVTYTSVEKFLRGVVRRDFHLSGEGALSNEEEKDLVRFLFDKIRNDGRPFIFPFYDPETHTRQQGYVRLVDSTVEEGEVVYQITADGIEFYLSTKEVRDESSISTEQVLLEKMIRTENFKGGIDVIRRINLEVEQLKRERREVVRLLQEDLNTGLTRSEAFMDRISKWFEMERKSFQKNKALVDKAVARAGTNAVVRDITTLEIELKNVIESHRMLMEEAADLSRLTTEMVERAKLRALRPAFDFRQALDLLKREDDPAGMQHVLMPFFLPRRRKSFSIFSIDKLVNEAVSGEEDKEKGTKTPPDLDFEYEDEKLSRMIGSNFSRLFKELLERLQRWGTVTLPEFNAILETKFGKEIYENKDYYAFLVHLTKKERYVMAEAFEEPETFLEAYAAKHFTEQEKAQFREMIFVVEPGEEQLELGPEKTLQDTDMDIQGYAATGVVQTVTFRTEG